LLEVGHISSHHFLVQRNTHKMSTSSFIVRTEQLVSSVNWKQTKQVGLNDEEE
jgi:hypothetical protein